MLISTWSDKGGTGKTTLAILIGKYFDAKLLDLDPQGDLLRWAEKAKCPCTALPTKSSQALIAAAKDKQLYVVDCPPGRTPASLQGMACSQIVVIPTRSGDSDLVALSRALESVETVQENGNPGLVPVVVLNSIRDTARARTLPHAMALAKNYKYIGEIKERVAYEESYSEGATVLAAPDSLAATEAKVVLDRLKLLVADQRRKRSRMK